MRCGLVGQEGTRGCRKPTLSKYGLEAAGQGLPPGADIGSQVGLGEGRGRPGTVLKGSPEHNLLAEAKVIISEGGHRAGKEEADMRAQCIPENIGNPDPAGKEDGDGDESGPREGET